MDGLIPKWLEEMSEEDISFIKNFMLCSGSLKQMAKIYNVTYPTMRLRLDRLIQKIELSDEEEESSFVSLVKRMAIEEKIDLSCAKVLITAYKKEKKGSD
ncbi:DUF2089 domain-containing protein [Eubacterium sp. MSJ-13]|nr:DUF2089 domain-containing protein [Eubacterium sp. MSJ-13]